MICVADTHAVVWFLEADERLGGNAREALQDPTSAIIIPALVLAEIQFLFTKGRIEASMGSVLSSLVAAKNCVVHPLDEFVAARLPAGLDP